MFEFKINECANENFLKENIRIAVRGIVILDNKILFVETNKGDLKLPGGGLNDGESNEQCLSREIAEETGYTNVKIDRFIGSYEMKTKDRFEDHTMFTSTSLYYLCTLENLIQKPVHLDDYEKDLDFKVKWYTLEEAIKQNEDAVLNNNPNEWVIRELTILLHIKQSLTMGIKYFILE